MTTIENTLINALLADATYVNDLTREADLTQALSARMTPTLAAYIDQRFDLVTQIETNDYVGSGFDATVGKRTDGRLLVSLRGTEPGIDLGNADVDLAFNGNARLQVVRDGYLDANGIYQGLVDDAFRRDDGVGDVDDTGLGRVVRSVHFEQRSHDRQAKDAACLA
jgi:hypothetical protein